MEAKDLLGSFGFLHRWHIHLLDALIIPNEPKTVSEGGYFGPVQAVGQIMSLSELANAKW